MVNICFLSLNNYGNLMSAISFNHRQDSVSRHAHENLCTGAGPNKRSSVGIKKTEFEFKTTSKCK